MSLRDQLLRAGLVTEEQARKAEQGNRKKLHQGKKNKKLGAADKAKKAEQQKARNAEHAAKRDADRNLNQQRDAVKRRRENAARIRQLIATNRVNDEKAELRYNFKAGKVVRTVRVTGTQQKQLALGQLGIARNPHDEFDFPIVPRDAAEKLAAIDPKLVVVLYEKTTALEEDDEWAAWEQLAADDPPSPKQD